MADDHQTGYKNISLSQLIKAPWNYKEDDPIQAEKLLANFRKNGQVENILVRLMDPETMLFEVINGNHRLETMMQLGFAEAFCFDFGVISEAHAMRIALETNEHRYPTNPAKLVAIVAELSSSESVDKLLQTLPFSGDEIRGMTIINKNMESGLKMGDSKNGKDKKKVRYFYTCEKCGQKHEVTQDGKIVASNNEEEFGPEDEGENEAGS